MNHKIAEIEEASGICYASKEHSLYVANDEGFIYRLDTTGKILQTVRLGHYDLEGIACDDKAGVLLLALEGKDHILVVDKKSMHLKKEIKIKKKFHKQLILKKDKKHGLEGITIIDEMVFLSNQKDPSLLLAVEKNYKKEKLSILDVYEHGHKDIAGLCYHDSKLYMISDRENRLFVYDIEKKRIEKSVKLPLFSQEGIAFDKDENIYIANDKGGILKFTKVELGL